MQIYCSMERRKDLKAFLFSAGLRDVKNQYSRYNNDVKRSYYLAGGFGGRDLAELRLKL